MEQGPTDQLGVDKKNTFLSALKKRRRSLRFKRKSSLLISINFVAEELRIVTAKFFDIFFINFLNIQLKQGKITSILYGHSN